MTKNFILLLLLLSSIYGENTGSLFIGTSSVGGNDEFRPKAFDVKHGLSIGFLLPIQVPIVDAHYKVRAAYHLVSSSLEYDDKKYRYVSASNVLLVGKTLPLHPKAISILPQIGLGLIYENIHSEWGSGYVYNLLYIDYSTKVTLPFMGHSIGLLFNIDKGIATSMDDFGPMTRLHISFVYSI